MCWDGVVNVRDVGGLPAAEGSNWDIGAPLADRGAGLADDLGAVPAGPDGSLQVADDGTAALAVVPLDSGSATETATAVGDLRDRIDGLQAVHDYGSRNRKQQAASALRPSTPWIQGGRNAVAPIISAPSGSTAGR